MLRAFEFTMGQGESSLAGNKRRQSEPSTATVTNKEVSDASLKHERRYPAGKRLRINEVRNRELHTTLVKQLEFYFSDSNLRKDRFLVDQMWADPGGWVKIDTLLTFNRIKDIGASIEDVLVALRAVKRLEVREQAESGASEPAKIGVNVVRIKGGLEELERILTRGPEEPEETRTVYAEPFEAKTTHQDVREKFEEYGSVVYISIPRFRDGNAKGFAFIEYEDAQSAKQCVRYMSIKAGGLRVMSKTKWAEKKEEYKRIKKERRRSAKNPLRRERRSVEYTDELSINESNKGEKPTAKGGMETATFKNGVVLAIQGLANGKEFTRKALFECLEVYGPVAYIDFKTKHPDVCKVRFIDPSSAENALQALSQPKAKLLDARISVRKLEGSEEKKYWELIAVRMQERSQKRDHKRLRKSGKHSESMGIAHKGDQLKVNGPSASPATQGKQGQGVASRQKENTKQPRKHIIFENASNID